MTLQFAPSQQALVSVVLDAHNEAAPGLRGMTSGCTERICKVIERRLKLLDSNIECCFNGDGRSKDEREWLVDFVAGIWFDRDDLPGNRGAERYLMQPLIVGEVEWSNNLDRDFDKLLVADSLVCFFSFPDRIKDPRHANGELEHYRQVAERRRVHAAQRGINPTPVYLIACYSEHDGAFGFRLVQ